MATAALSVLTPFALPRPLHYRAAFPPRGTPFRSRRLAIHVPPPTRL